MKKQFVCAIVVAAPCLLATFDQLLAGGGMELAWHSFDGGGVMHSTNGTVELSSTIGQADAGRMSGSNWELTGGFWFEIVAGDVNADAAVNAGDLLGLDACLDGPLSPLVAGCERFDFNFDDRVDMEDVALFQVFVNAG